MTIDEAITHAREVSSRKFDDRVHCIRCSEFHKQLAEWLEELKKYQENNKKIVECIHSSNRGSCDYFIVDQIEELMKGIGYDE